MLNVQRVHGFISGSRLAQMRGIRATGNEIEIRLVNTSEINVNIVATRLNDYGFAVIRIDHVKGNIYLDRSKLA